ncbi:MAG: TonB family protein [Marinilabiliales bacterium]|nr:TonB family protein [Marinilabiliales bacterium]
MVQDKQFIPTFDDIVFEHRNKEYGAYQIRKKYNRVVLIATLIGMFILGTAIIVPYIKASNEAKHAKRDANEVIAEMAKDIQNEAAPPPPPPPPPPPSEQQTVVKYVAPVVVDSVKVEDQSKLMISEDQVATTVNKDVVEVVETKHEEVQQEEKKEEVFVVVEEMPEFPGGEAALRTYIAKAIVYPTVAQENGIQGKVFVTFVVNKDGSVSNAKVARGVDPSLDTEALRVVNSLPKGKPGNQRGVPVRVSYTVPISFKLQ